MKLRCKLGWHHMLTDALSGYSMGLGPDVYNKACIDCSYQELDAVRARATWVKLREVDHMEREVLHELAPRLRRLPDGT